MSYKLINPVIEGKLKTTFTAKNDLDAANKAWTNISKYISNNVPKFAFTLENINDGSLSHFMVKEKLNGNKNASFNLTKLKVDSDSRKEKEFRNRITQAGGKRDKNRKNKKDDEEEEEDLEEEDDTTTTTCSPRDIINLSPSSAFSTISPYSALSAFSPYSSVSNFSPYSSVSNFSPFSPYNVYQYPIEYWWYDPYYYSLDSLFIPTFVYPLTPYVEITTLNYYPYQI